MIRYWKRTVGAMLGTAMISGLGLTPAFAATATTAPATVERGIKDPGVKGCGKCGVTGRTAAPAAQGSGLHMNDGAPTTERKKGTNKPIIWNPDGTISRERAPVATEGASGAPASTERTRTIGPVHPRPPANETARKRQP